MVQKHETQAKVLYYTLDENATIAADGNSTNSPGAQGATSASLYVTSTQDGTTPSLNVQLQTRDPLGNWHDVGSGVTLAHGMATTASDSELAIAGPFGTHFRAVYDVDVANMDETYTAVDVAIALEF